VWRNYIKWKAAPFFLYGFTMPRGGRPSRTPTPSVGPSVISTPKNDSSRFGLLREMLQEDGLWESGSDDSSCHSDYDFNNDSDTVASLMLGFLASGGKEKPKKKKGKGKRPAPKKSTSSGVSKTAIQQQTNLLEEAYADESDDLDMPQDKAEMIVRKAVIKVMD
jgi:hypothetical protein